MSSSEFGADTNNNGVIDSIRWSRIMSTAIGVVLGVLGIKLADLVDAIVSIPVAIYQTVANVAGGLVGALVGGPTALIDAAVREASQFIRGFGLFGFVLAVGLVVGTAYLVARARGVSG